MNELQRLADIKAQVYSLDKLYQQQWEEEFRTTKDNALDVVDLSSYGFEYDDLNNFVNNNIDHAITYWDGGGSLVDRERGRYARRIMAGSRNLI